MKHRLAEAHAARVASGERSRKTYTAVDNPPAAPHCGHQEDLYVARLAEDDPDPPSQASQLPRALFEVVWEQLHGESAAAADTSARYHHPSIEAADLAGRSAQHPDSPPLLRLLAKDLQCSKLHAVSQGGRLLRLRQEMLAMVHICLQGAGGVAALAEGQHPALQGYAHLKLAEAYHSQGCTKQAVEHCRRSVEELERNAAGNWEGCQPYLQRARALCCDQLLRMSPPRAQEAMQLVRLLQDSDVNATAAAPQRDWLLALAARCSCAVSSQTLETAKGMSAELSPLLARLAELERGKEQRGQVQGADRELRDLRELVMQLQEQQQTLLAQAESGLEGAVDNLMQIISCLESEMKRTCAPEGAVKEGEEGEEGEGSSEAKEESYGQRLLRALYTKGAEVMMVLAAVKGLQGDDAQRLSVLQEVTSVQARYGFLPHGLLAKMMQAKGALLVQFNRAEAALGVYQELLELQHARYRSQPAKQAFHTATALKLQGNVHVALKQFSEARQCYQAALTQYRKQCGAESAVVLELEQRMHEVLQYTLRR